MHLINKDWKSNMIKNKKENLIEYLAELAENEIPITYKSLVNTLEKEFAKSSTYYRDCDLNENVFGGWIAASIENLFTFINIVPYSRELKKTDIIHEDDEILIVKMVIENNYVRYKNNKYCR